MQVTINGQLEELSDGTTVAALLDRLRTKPGRVAVEVNEDLVPCGDFTAKIIRPGDRIEVVTFVGGG